jgi:hypothetical protein
VSRSGYTEDTLVQQTTAEYLEKELGRESVYAYNNEIFLENPHPGPLPEGEGKVCLGRALDREVVLVRLLREKLVELNKGLPAEAYDDAVRQITATVASQTLLATNREKYDLIKNGVQVTFRNEKGERVRQRLRVFDFSEPENNHFLCVRELRVRGTLYPLPVGVDEALMPSLLTLADVMGTGHHAARIAKVSPGKSVAVIGDGAVGLCGVIAAKRLGAEQIIMMGRHPDRIALAQEFGATQIVSERGDEAVERVRALAGGFGVHSVLECVGTEQAINTAIEIARPGGAVGRAGVPHYSAVPPETTFFKNVVVGGGPAPVRAYIDELLPDVLDGHIQPGRVFDRLISLDEVPEGYRAMDKREAIKVMVKP